MRYFPNLWHSGASRSFLKPLLLSVSTIAGLTIAVLLATTLWPVSQTQAITGSSWQTAWKATGSLYDLQALSADAIIGVGSEGMVIKSENGGASWSYLTLDPKFHLYAVDFVDAAQGLAVGTKGVFFLTADGGQTWLPGNTGAGVDLHGLSMVDANHGWAAGERGALLRTDDGGETWSRVSSGVQDDLYDITFVDADNGWAVGDNGVILHSIDGGATWQRQSIQARTDLRSITFTDKYHGWAVGTQGVILSTINGGGRWEAETDTGFPESDFQDVSCAAHECYVVGSAGATLRFDGASWTRYYDLGDNDRILYAVAALGDRQAWTGGTREMTDVEFPNSQLTYDAWGVFFTRDGGAYWRLKVGDLFPRFRKLHFVNDEEGYVVGGDWSYRRTLDGGKTWTQYQTLPEDKEEHQFYYDIDCLDVNNCFIVGRYGTVRRTRNGGVTWQEQGIIDSPSGIGRGYGKFLYSVAFQDDLHAFSGGSYRFFFTDDGYHWRRASTTSGNVFDIELIGATDGMAATSTAYIMRRSSNDDWRQQSTNQSGVKLYGVDAKDANGDGRIDKAWLVGCVSNRCDDEAAIVYSQDGGSSWQRVYDLPQTHKLSDVSMADDQTGWAVGDSGAILYTVDGGSTWTAQFSPVTAHLESVQALGPNLAFASGWDGVILRYGPPPRAFNARPHSYLASIDGVFDEWGDDVMMHIDALLAYVVQSYDNQSPTQDDISAAMRVRWLENALFLAIDVSDDDVTNKDAVSVAIDGLNDNLWNTDDVQFTIYADGKIESESRGLTGAVTLSDHGYRVEASIPASLLGNNLATGRSVGLNLALNDEDSDGSSARLIWSAPTLADTPDRFADVLLAPFDDDNQQIVAYAANGQVTDGDLDDWDALGAIILDAASADAAYGLSTDASASWQLQWQPQGLLGAIRVTDADIQPDDGVIFALDGDDDGRRASPEDIILSFSPDGIVQPPPDVVSFVHRTHDGYNIEFFIPAPLLGDSLAHGRSMGVNLSLADAQDGRDGSMLVWQGLTPTGNFGDFGHLLISDRLWVLQMGRDGYTGVEDANIDNFHPADNFSAAPTHSWRGNPNKSTVIRFDMSAFPANATATGGDLAFSVLTDADQDLTASAYALARDWDIDVVSWGYAQLGVRWQVAGAQGEEDRIEPASDAQPLTGPGWLHFDVGQDVRAILNDGALNRGWLIEPTGAFVEYQVAASEYHTPSLRPQLTIRYVLPTANQPVATPTPTPTSTATPTPTLTPTATPIPLYLPVIFQTYIFPPMLLPELAPLSINIEPEQSMTCTDPNHPAVLGLRARFINRGTAASDAFVVEINGERKDAPGLDVNEEGGIWLPGFAIGANTLKLDVDNQIVEFDESNNQLVETLPIPTPLPTCTP